MSNQYVTSKGRTITLDEKLGDGAEGEVYRVKESPSEAFKLYRTEKRTSDRECKLEAMILSPPQDDPRSLSASHISITWPTETVYEHNTKSFVGFIMPLISKSPNIYEIYNPKLRNANQINITWMHLHRIARNLATALNSLHEVGHVMGDVNQKNILVNSNSLVTLVDTDSFQILDSRNRKVWRCTVGVGEYTPPELQGLTFSSVERTIYHDHFGLAVLIFQILMGGFHPFMGAPKNPNRSLLATTPDEQIKAGIFPYQSNGILNPPFDAPNFQYLHPEIQTLFIRCFINGHKEPKIRPTSQDWISVLVKAENDLIQCKKNLYHWYSSHVGKCHWCDYRKSNISKNIPYLPAQIPLPISSGSSGLIAYPTNHPIRKQIISKSTILVGLAVSLAAITVLAFYNYQKPASQTRSQQTSNSPSPVPSISSNSRSTPVLPSTNQTNQSPIYKIDLTSEENADYSTLRSLLINKKWQEADQETLSIMLQVARRRGLTWEKGEWDGERSNIPRFPCSDLKTVDQLWRAASQNAFGFSVQNKIWEDLGGAIGPNQDSSVALWNSYNEIIGTRVNGKGLSYSELNFSTSAPRGHLPALASGYNIDFSIMRIAAANCGLR